MAGGVDLSIGAPDDPEVAAGPELDDGLADFDAPVLEEAPHVDESVVRGILNSFGGALNHVAGDDDVEDHWRFTPREIDDLAPPLTRYINRQPKLRRAVARGDELAIAVAVAGYVGRNISDAQQARAARGADHDDLDREAPRPPGPPGAPTRADHPGGPRGHGSGGGDLLRTPDGGGQDR